MGDSVSSAEEQAQQMWNAAELASRILPVDASIHLGCGVPMDVLREIARIAGVRLQRDLHITGAPHVIEHIEAKVGRVFIRAQGSRPATVADASLLAWSDAGLSRATEADVAAALGVGQ